jgi:hypothetical protein
VTPSKPGIFRAFLLCATASVFPLAYSQTSPQSSAQTADVPASKPTIRRALALTKFYDAPNPLPAGKPGELIRSQDFDQYDLPLHVLAERILYHSRSASGSDVAVSGVVLHPDANPPADGWPVLAWAHALDGVARQCAPSLARNLRSGPALSMYVSLGYAVVLTDYAGLGTSFRNAASDLPSNATDLIHSVPAARAAVPHLSSRWIAIGTGQGGAVVIKAAEIEHEIQDPNYLGSIAISGLEGSYDPSSLGNLDQPLITAYGIKSVFREFNERDVLSEKALALYPKLEQSCAYPSEAQVDSAELLKPDWASNRFVKIYFERNILGQKPARGPILIIDSGLPRQHTIQTINRLYQERDQVELERYEQSDEGSVFGDSVRDQIAWIQARFGGHPASTTCSSNR